MVDQAASRPKTGNADHTAPFMRVDLREETVTEHATPGMLHGVSAIVTGSDIPHHADEAIIPNSQSISQANLPYRLACKAAYGDSI